MFGKEKHPYFEMMQGTFGAGADNPHTKVCTECRGV